MKNKVPITNKAFLKSKKVRDKVFKKLFKMAEIAKNKKQEKHNYHDTIKYYRDMKNSLDTAYEDGILAGKLEVRHLAIMEEKITVAKSLKQNGVDFSLIAQCTDLSIEEIEKL